MNLRRKLARLSGATRAADGGSPVQARADAPESGAGADGGALQHGEPDAARAAKIAELRALIGEAAGRHERRASRKPRIEVEESASLPWFARETAHGLLHLIERDLDPDHHHGRVPVGSALSPSASTVAALTLDPSTCELDLTRMLLLDTETTGLSGGTGTVAFLVGLARFEGGALRLEQLILPNLGDEGPMLAHLAQRLRDASCIVTYNGKSFDWPLLRTRFVLGRMPAPPLPPHIDLLHATRRVWKARLGSVRLTEIEREILHFEREGDIHGSEIPARYFSFLREGGAQRLVPIIEHNQNDLIALAAMLGRLGRHYEDAGSVEHAQDALALGKLSARARDKPRALGFAQRALDESQSKQTSCAALELASEVERKFGDAAAAVRALESALALTEAPVERARLHLALAKLYERKLRDAASALSHAQHTEACEGMPAHERRLGRLQRRIERAAQRGGG